MKKRRTYLIKSGFQVKVILLFVLLGLSGSLLSGLLIYFNLEERFNAIIFSGHMQFRNAGEVVFPVIVTVTLNVVLVSLLAAVAAVIYITRRMENIFSMFRENCLRVKGGDLTTRVPYLYNNLTDDLTTGMNALITSLEDSSQNSYSSLDTVLNLADMLEKKIAKRRSPEELHDAMEQLLKQIGDLEIGAGRFSALPDNNAN